MCTYRAVLLLHNRADMVHRLKAANMERLMVVDSHNTEALRVVRSEVELPTISHPINAN